MNFCALSHASHLSVVPEKMSPPFHKNAESNPVPQKHEKVGILILTRCLLRLCGSIWQSGLVSLYDKTCNNQAICHSGGKVEFQTPWQRYDFLQSATDNDTDIGIAADMKKKSSMNELSLATCGHEAGTVIWLIVWKTVISRLLWNAWKRKAPLPVQMFNVLLRWLIWSPGQTKLRHTKFVRNKLHKPKIGGTKNS